MGKITNWLSRLLQKKQLNPLRSVLGHEGEFNQEIKFDRWRDDLGQYDVVDLTSMRVEATTALLTERDFREALSKPPLNDFAFKINDSEGNEENFLLHCYGKHSRRILADNGRAYAPLLDIMQLDAEHGAVSIMQILTPKSRYMQVFEVRPAASALDWIDKEALSAMDAAANYVLWHYAYTSKKFKNCPDCFVESKHGERRRLIFEEKTAEPLRTVEVIHKIHEESDSVEDEGNTEDSRKIACPYWTVRGHYRTLKSGKRIWIEPYAKGSDRNNPKRNVPKTYTILEREE